MGAFSLVDAAAYVAGYDFTTDTNNIMLNTDVASLPTTTFATDGWGTVTGGLKTVKFDMKGFWQSAASAAVDPESFPDLGVIDRVFTVSPIEAGIPNPAPVTDQHAAFLFRAGKFRYLPFGATVGDVAPFELGAVGSNGQGMKKGLLLQPKGTVSATGQMGATFDTLGFGVSAAAFVWATVHVFAAATTITIQVQSDDNTGFTTPTTVATIGPLTTTGGTWMTPVAGPNTDRYYRFNVSAVTGSFSIAAAMAIQA